MGASPKQQSGKIFGTFRLVSCLGVNGFSEVWTAEHIELPGKREVIKFVKDHKTLELLREEGAVMHNLQHVGIVQVTDMDTSGNTPYLRLEYVEGKTLEKRMQLDKQIPWRKALEITWQIADILEFAHEQHVWHGDLKPSNIFLCSDSIKLGDFGLGTYYVQHKDSLEFSESLKEADEQITSIWNYMSPEQKQGKINARTDIYSLGVILYRMITGNLPVGLETPSARAPECPKEIDSIVSNMLAPLDKRYRTMTDIKEDIANLMQVQEKKPSNIWEMLCFILGVCLILFAIGFLYRIPWGLVVVSITGFVFLEQARPKIRFFWPLLFFWVGVGTIILGFVSRLYFFIPAPIILTIVGGAWFLLAPDEKEHEDSSIARKKSSQK